MLLKSLCQVVCSIIAGVVRCDVKELIQHLEIWHQFKSGVFVVVVVVLQRHLTSDCESSKKCSILFQEQDFTESKLQLSRKDAVVLKIIVSFSSSRLLCHMFFLFLFCSPNRRDQLTTVTFSDYQTGQLSGFSQQLNSLKRQADLISCCLYRSHAPLHEKKFHHKPSPNLSPTTSINILLRQKGVVATRLIKTLNSVLLHLSCTLFFSPMKSVS